MAWPITFLSDYGLTDEFVGVVHGVIARVCPEARVIDVAHGIPRHDVLAGGLALRRALPFMPPGVHLAVVDPDVGARRRAIAVRTAEEDRLLVGPDNGLLTLGAEAFGGCVEAVEVSRSPWRLEPVSATFHGRDVFAPVAARLAAGASLSEGGEPIDVEELVVFERPQPEIGDDGGVVAQALAFDTFGNVTLNVDHADLARTKLRLGRPVTLDVYGRTYEAMFAHTFADVGPGELLVYEDPARVLAIAVSSGDAAKALGLEPGDAVRIAPA